MLNLEAISSLPLGLDASGQISFGPGIMVDASKVRRLDELSPVALDPESCRGSQEIAYFTYNGVYLQSDAVRLAGVPLRYDLTLIPPHRLGREFSKTFGHLHTIEPNSGLTYPEIYEVLAGTAHFFFQTLDVAGPDAAQVCYIEAHPGDKVIIPPGLDHLTINPGPGPLLFSDVIALDCRGNYERYRASRGAAYLEIEGEDGAAQFIPNPHYRTVAPLRRAPVHNYPALHLTSGEPLYAACVAGRGKHWAFLTQPNLFETALPGLARQFKG